MSSIWQSFKNFFWNILIVPFLPLLKFFGPLGALITVGLSSGDLIDTLISMINSLSSYVASAPSNTVVAQINRVAPLSEGLAMFAALITLRLYAIGVRIILKFLPFSH